MTDDRIKFDVLVLGPGGAKGYLELGALLKLKQEGYLDDISKIVGCSVGSIIGLLLITGYSPEEIFIISLLLNFFQDIHSVKIDNIVKNEGLISNDKIKIPISFFVKEKLGFVPTLEQLYNATGIEFTIVAVNITKCRVEYINYENNPGLSCVDAALLSVNIPFLFYNIKHNNDLYIDGKFGNPYPIDIYDTGENNILGVHITTPYEVEEKESDHNFINYILRVLCYPFVQIKRNNIDQCSDKCYHLNLHSDQLYITDVSMSVEEKGKLFILGYTTSDEFCKKLNSNKLSISD